MEKKLFKNSEKVTVRQEAAKNLSQESICVRGVLGTEETAWTISNPTVCSQLGSRLHLDKLYMSKLSNPQ